MAMRSWLVENYDVDGNRRKFKPGVFADTLVWADIVWFEENIGSGQVRDSLVGHDGYPSTIVVTPNADWS